MFDVWYVPDNFHHTHSLPCQRRNDSASHISASLWVIMLSATFQSIVVAKHTILVIVTERVTIYFSLKLISHRQYSELRLRFKLSLFTTRPLFTPNPSIPYPEYPTNSPIQLNKTLRIRQIPKLPVSGTRRNFTSIFPPLSLSLTYEYLLTNRQLTQFELWRISRASYQWHRVWQNEFLCFLGNYVQYWSHDMAKHEIWCCTKQLFLVPL
jgi:hypothetical protein